MNNSGRASLQEGMLSTVYMALAARAVWRHRPMYSRWLTGSIPGTVNLRRSRRLLRSAAIRKPASDPLYSETPIFHTEHLKSELCTLLFKEREKAGERRKIFLKISGRDWFPDGHGYLVCLPGNQFRWSLIEQRSLVCNVKYCIAFCETENFQILPFSATPVFWTSNIFEVPDLCSGSEFTHSPCTVYPSAEQTDKGKQHTKYNKHLDQGGPEMEDL